MGCEMEEVLVLRNNFLVSAYHCNGWAFICHGCMAQYMSF